ncbi:amylo-alpha-1,6-glucosidase [Paenibacillus macerans]|uniref:amylo-alpha-1,6-glucosidase n=1 Tax=Paenibacillus macerans TaxID=44252 RepID=UPI00203C2EFE|nr:amylo-alpha-1,6-glucosidase [Paenibacillus macerans]
MLVSGGSTEASLYPGQEPLYNTVDTPLGYIHIHASYEYLKHTGGEDDYRFIREAVYPKLKEIVAGSPSGTEFLIAMDRTG